MKGYSSYGRVVLISSSVLFFLRGDTSFKCGTLEALDGATNRDEWPTADEELMLPVGVLQIYFFFSFFPERCGISPLVKFYLLLVLSPQTPLNLYVFESSSFSDASLINSVCSFLF